MTSPLNRQKANALTLILPLLLLLPGAMAAQFNDITGTWAEAYVTQLTDKGVIAPDSDNKFHGSEPVTRAYLASWLVKVLGIENQPVSPAPSFSDVKPTDWFFKAVEIIRQNNYISGYVDGFRPNQYIQKGEVITILARTLNTTTPSDSTQVQELSKYLDGMQVPEWARAGVTLASQTGILVNYPDASTINATTIATRADAAALLSRLSQYLAHQSAPSAGATTTVTSPTTPPSTESGFAPIQRPPLSQAGMLSQGGYGPTYRGQSEYFGRESLSSNYLTGHVVVLGAGTHFQATLKNSIDSGSSQPGEEIQATLSSPIYSEGVEVLPAGSRIVGQITNVVSARRFQFGANGRVDIRFTAIETLDGRRFPLSASVNTSQLRLAGGTTAGRVGKGLATVGVGAAAGALFGTALGPIVGATSHGHAGKATGMGAVFGTAIGATAGTVGAGVRKGSEVKIPAGTSLPIQLDESLQVTLPHSFIPQQPYIPYPGGSYYSPGAQPSGGYWPVK
ncbi:MAG: S-layer homology domain-containing protein [Candidatus Melainabacteria bacterium]|nr:S-layer homology domain-containing protein [Candidatus Melainabacteria bacterium]